MIHGSVGIELSFCEKKYVWLVELKMMMDVIWIGVEFSNDGKGNY